MFKWIRAVWQSTAADEAYEAGDYQRSYAEAEKTLAIDPNSSAGLFVRARAGVFLEPPNWEQVQNDAERAIALEFEEDELYCIAARAAYERKDYAKSLERARQLLGRSKTSTCGHQYQSLSLFYLRRFKEAIEALDLSLRNKFDPDMMHWRGHTKTFTGDIEGAVRDLGEALQHMPDNTYALKGRVQMLGVLGRFDEALADASRMVELKNADSESLTCRGNLRLAAGQVAAAREDYRAFLARHSADLRSWQSPQRVETPLLHAPDDLFDEGHVDNAAAVLLTFDRSLLGNRQALFELVRRSKACRLDGDPLQRQVAVAVSHDIAELHRRKPLPREFTGGPEVFVADLYIYRSLLPQARLVRDQPFLSCAAEPVSGGRIALLPAAKLAWRDGG